MKTATATATSLFNLAAWSASSAGFYVAITNGVTFLSYNDPETLFKDLPYLLSGQISKADSHAPEVHDDWKTLEDLIHNNFEADGNAHVSSRLGDDNVWRQPGLLWGEQVLIDYQLDSDIDAEAGKGFDAENIVRVELID